MARRGTYDVEVLRAIVCAADIIGASHVEDLSVWIGHTAHTAHLVLEDGRQELITIEQRPGPTGGKRWAAAIGPGSPTVSYGKTATEAAALAACDFMAMARRGDTGGHGR